jgi:Predicted membrane protein (DUF2238)
MSSTEALAVGIVLCAMVGFAAYGFATGAPSTVSYVFTVGALGLLISALRRAPLPAPLAIAIAVQAVAHLAGGLIRVGNDVLYNASLGTHVAVLHTHILQYDHVVHAFGAGVGTLTVWTLLAPGTATVADRRSSIVLCLLAGLGIGALNETFEFLATIAHQGAHVGGYTNTGWDLVSNSIGALVAAKIILTSPRELVAA